MWKALNADASLEREGITVAKMDELREDFESWARGRCLELKMHPVFPDHYREQETRDAWASWQVAYYRGHEQGYQCATEFVASGEECPHRV